MRTLRACNTRTKKIESGRRTLKFILPIERATFQILADVHLSNDQKERRVKRIKSRFTFLQVV